MNKHRLTAMVTAVAFAGFMHALAAQENTDIAPADNASQQITSEQKPLEETPAPVATTPAQALAQSNDKLLSEMKVYPSF
jgi:glucose/arabinose dehydrogenase